MSDTDPASSQEAIQAVAARLLGRNNWALIPADDLARRIAVVLALGQPGPVSERPGRRGQAADPVAAAALRSYAEALHSAFSGAEGRERQDLAYRELVRYAYFTAGRLGPELSHDEREDLAHHVVSELYYRVAPVRDAHAPPVIRQPGAFVSVVIQQVQNGLRRRRNAGRHLCR